jgi:hypothetical protein
MTRWWSRHAFETWGVPVTLPPLAQLSSMVAISGHRKRDAIDRQQSDAHLRILQAKKREFAWPLSKALFALEVVSRIKVPV